MIRHFTTIILLVFIFLFTFILGNHRLVSPSMEDTLLTGDKFIVLKFWYGLRMPFSDRILIKFREPEPGDLVIFKYPINPKEIHIKRCVAIGGQAVEIIE